MDPPDDTVKGDTTTIGRYSPKGDSPYGCADMAGNVWEWCQIYEPYPYQTDDGREDLKAEGSRVLRGGAFRCYERFIRCAVRLRYDPNYWGDFIGFRLCVAARQE